MEQNGIASLYKKISKVMFEVKRVPKNGHNKFHNYDYATESDLIESIRSIIHEAGLAFFPSVLEEQKVDEFTKVKMEFTLADTETGHSIKSIFWGEGQDKGDKGLYKAYTGATKYFLMKTFLIPTGDDPEMENEQPAPPKKTHQNQTNQTQRPQQQQTKKPSQNQAPQQSKPAQPQQQPQQEQQQAKKNEGLGPWNNLADQNQEQQRKPVGLASEKQLKKIFAVAKTLEISNNDMKEIVMARTGKQTSKELTSKEASELIKYLENDMKAELEKKQDQEAEKAYASFDKAAGAK